MTKLISLFIILFLAENMFSQGIGIMSEGPHTLNLYKGESKKIFTYYVINYGDYNEDGVKQYLGYTSEYIDYQKHWFSFYDSLQSEVHLVPPQGIQRMPGQLQKEEGFINTSNLRVGRKYWMRPGACSEISGGVIGARACINTGLQSVYVIPYEIPITSIENSRGSYSSFIVGWLKPTPLYWNLRKYAIFRKDGDSVRINELNQCDLIRTDIPSTEISKNVNDSKRGINSYYAIVGYDSLGEAIAISQSFQITYEKNNFSLLTPSDGQILTSRTPTLDWEDYIGAVGYTLWYSEDPLFTSKTEITGITSSEYTFTSPLADNRTYYWLVKTEGDEISNEIGWNFGINSDNISPSPFSLIYPTNYQSVNSLVPTFTWQNALDNGDDVTYTIQVATDALFNDIVMEKAASVVYYHCVDSLEDNTEYFWRVKAEDTQGQVIWSNETYVFDINFDDYPNEFELAFPNWNQDEIPVETNLYPEFKWTKSADGDGINNVTYKLWYGRDHLFNDKIEVAGITDTFYVPTIPLIEDQYYYWKVFAIDDSGNIRSSCGLPYAFVTNSVNIDPSSPLIFYPASGDSVQPKDTTFTWTKSFDTDPYDIFVYDVEIATDINFTNIIQQHVNNSDTTIQIAAMEPGSYFWRVKSHSIKNDLSSGGFNYSGTSSFTVTNKYLTLLYPSVSDKLVQGAKQFIVWESNYNCSNLKIEYSTDNGSHWEIIDDNANSCPNYYLWVVSNNLSTEAIIKITDNNFTNLTTTSDVFQIIFMAPDSDLVLYLPLDHKVVLDISGNGFIGGMQGGTFEKDRNANDYSAVKFENIPCITDQGIIVPNTYLNLRNGFTFCAWVKLLNFNNENYLLYKYDYANNKPFGLNTTKTIGKLGFWLGYAGITSNNALPLNEWIFVCATIDSLGNSRIYQNDLEIARGECLYPETYEDKFFFGTYPPLCERNTNGFLDEIKIFDRSMTHQEIINLYTNNNPPNYNITLLSPNGGEVWWEDENQEILWNSENVLKVRIEFSSDNGKNWEIVGDSLDASLQRFSWAIPEKVYSDSCKIKITGIGNPDFVFDYSNSVFSIHSIFSNTNINLPELGYSAADKHAADWGDYDNDGDLDLAIMLRAYKSYIFRNDDGNFIDIGANLIEVNRGQVLWFDVDNDNDLDLLISGKGDYNNTPSALYINDEGSFNLSPFSFVGTYHGSFTSGDYNNDGSSDILITGDNQWAWPLRFANLYKNQDGILSNSNIQLPAVGSSDASLIDFDNDMDLDILIGGYENSESQYITKLFFNENESFIDKEMGLPQVNSCNFSWADYDSDGDQDLLISGETVQERVTKLFKNEMDSLIEISIPIPGLDYCNASWGDYDNDGDLDLIINGRNSDTTSLCQIYKNEQGSFIEQNYHFPSSWDTPPMWVDYDNDGDLDIYILGKIYRNNTSIINIPPEPPTNLYSSINGNLVFFNWDRPMDDHTSSNGLTFNLRIGTTPGGCEIMSALSDPETGYRKISKMGNVQSNTSWLIKNLNPGIYYWSVQAIDNTFAGSTFATEQSFTFGLKVIPEGLYDPITDKLRMRDTIKTYLRNISSPYSIVDSAKAIIDSVNFTCAPLFTNAPSGTYYLVIKHRNSIETWSKAGGEVYNTGVPLSYDFTISSSQAYGNNLKQKGTKWCIYGGEIANDDEYIDGDDVTAAFNAQGISGYVLQDVTGDDYVDGDDVTLVFNNQGVGTITPGVGLLAKPKIKIEGEINKE